ncbi:dol-P-Glc:Glc(2)Man(9)GlcNAc(2)-PP-Dol alpha-1,2-glucosyltransferase-like [Mytilus galloprovincialis]|uniref:dol-P-Glc:Glc(2)Man(9)GlcNAc(2)-PP-Dol alpha-1,2-glucosyltransferase-like n=1 Tax=Mytilus galloprovincialis TaxID=29158 RepID=UPI003F7C2C5D
MNFPVALAFLVLLFALTFFAIHNEQEDPYMDEIFHIPQAKQYCQGNFSHWDPMITTLPGLYLMSVGILVPVGKALGVETDNVCSVLWLRSVNLLFAIGNFYIIYAIMCKLHQKEKIEPKIIITALTLSLLPLLFFFNFLYYTDVGSTFFVLFMYLLHLQGNKALASLVGIIAIMFRQTNIIWVVFMAGLTARQVIVDWFKEKSGSGYQRKSIKEHSNPSTATKPSGDSEVTLFQIVKLLSKPPQNKQLDLIYLIFRILKSSVCNIMIILGFLVFVYVNQGIVVGDRSHHTAGLNFPQLFYFISFTSVFAFPYMVTPGKIYNFLTSFSKISSYVKALIFVTISFLLIHYFTYVHLYTLSDNRHYTFYIWSRLYSRHYLVKYLLIPVYMYSYWSFSTLFNTNSHTDEIWKIVFSICLIAATVPQKLLEFRYFIIPYLIFRLNIRPGSWVQLWTEAMLYIVVNFLTIYLFVNKPFKWENSSDVQRFIW